MNRPSPGAIYWALITKRPAHFRDLQFGQTQIVARGGAAQSMFESIAAWMVVALFALGVWLMASAVWGSPARAKPAVTNKTPARP